MKMPPRVRSRSSQGLRFENDGTLYRLPPNGDPFPLSHAVLALPAPCVRKQVEVNSIPILEPALSDPILKFSSDYVHNLPIEARDRVFINASQSGITQFFGGVFKTIAGFAGLTVLTALTGSALVPLIGVPFLCEWLSNKGGDQLAKWAKDSNLYSRTAFAGVEESALVPTLARQLQQALAQNAALSDDLDRFVKATHSIRTFVNATTDDKHLQGELFTQLLTEVNQHRASLNHLLSADLETARTMIINTGGGAYIGGNLEVVGSFTGRDHFTQGIPLTFSSTFTPATKTTPTDPSLVGTYKCKVTTEGGGYVAGDAKINGDFVGRDGVYSNNSVPLAQFMETRDEDEILTARLRSHYSTGHQQTMG